VLQKVRWIPPVERAEELPTDGVVEGSMCYVEGDVTGDEEVWEFHQGAWRRVD
jgi:hypothetical protein